MTGNTETRRRDYVLVAALLLLALSLGLFKVGNADIFWHLKTGEWILENLEIPKTDFFSFTRAGTEWIDAQWLFQAIIHLIHAAAGGVGLSLFVTVLVLAVTVIMYRSAPAEMPAPLKSAAALLLLLALNPRIMCRPEMLTFLYLALMFLIHEKALRGPAKLLLAAPPVQLLFVNSQGLWPIGVAVSGAYLLDAIVRSARSMSFGEALRARLPWLVSSIAVAAVCLAQPYGVDGLLFPLTLVSKVIAPDTPQKLMISEFLPVWSRQVPRGVFIPFALLALLSAVAVVRTGREARPGLVALAAVSTFLGVTANRNSAFASIVLFQALTVHAETARRRGGLLDSEFIHKWTAAAVVAAALAFSALSLLPSTRTWDTSARERGPGIAEKPWFPVGAADFLEDIGYEGNIMNGMNTGGYLIWRGWPKWRVFADPRLEVGGQRVYSAWCVVWGDLERFNRVAAAQRADAAVFTYRPPYDQTVSMLARDRANWALVLLDSDVMVFLRRTERAKEAIDAHEIRINPGGKSRAPAEP